MEAPEEQPKRHTNNDIWGRIHDQGKQIADLQTGLGKLEARVEGGFQNLSSQLNSVLNSIDRLSAPKPPADFKGWVHVGLTILGTLGLIGLLVVNPIRDNQTLREQRQWEIHGQQQYERGYHDATRARP